MLAAVGGWRELALGPQVIAGSTSGVDAMCKHLTASCSRLITNVTPVTSQTNRVPVQKLRKQRRYICGRPS